MRRLILLALIGTFLISDVTSKVHEYPLKLAWLFGSSRLNDNREETRTVCDSEECKKMANTMLGNMNKSVDPCNDFYEYACGRWVEHNPIPDRYNKWMVLSVLQQKVDKQIKDIVEAESTKDDLRPVRLAKKWYKACMDMDAIEREGLEPLVSTLSQLGGWPMTMGEDKSDEQEYNWQKVDDHYMRLMGRNTFHDVRIKEDSEDPVVVEIDSPHLPPGSKKLRSALESVSKDKDEEEDEENEGKSASDEDPSDEEKQSEEEPGSEGEDDSKIDDNDNDDDDDGDDGDDDDDDSDDNDDYDDDTKEQDENGLKEVGKKKITSKIGRRKNQKLRHLGQRKSGTRITKQHGSHTAKRHRIRRWAIGTEADNKRTQRFNRRGTQKSQRNHVRMVRRRRTKKILDNVENTTTIPQASTKKTSNDKLTLLRRYADYISKVARVIAKEQGTDIPQQRLENDIQDMIQFQLKLIKIIPDSSSIFSGIFNLEATLDDFQEWYDRKNPKTTNGKIDWVNKIKALFDEANEPVDGNLNLDVISPSYIEALASLLDETPNRTIVNYIHWNFISKTIKTTTKEMRELYEWWERINKGKQPSDRSDVCKDSAEMKDILAFEFVRKYFSDDIVKTASGMLNNVQKEMEYLIKESDWMDDDAKDFALAKLKNLKKLIGYPNWYKNATIIEGYFKGLVLGTSYYENALQYSRYTKWKSLRKLSNLDKTLADPAEVNAYYLPFKNLLTVTAADFQSPIFAYDRPQAINYGAIGLIMAHEVNHGFDNTGHMFDKDGNYLLWLSAMAGSYDKKKDCFVEQFNNYPIDEKTNEKIKDYGEQTTGDNIADTMGLQAIFKAYQREERESNTSDASLPGMEDVTNDQMFFLSFASTWCEAIDSNELMKIAKGDVHSIGRLRVIGSVSNSDDFAKAYNCPAGSPMNPEKKCNIWK